MWNNVSFYVSSSVFVVCGFDSILAAGVLILHYDFD